jgi:hypothetical protein
MEELVSLAPGSIAPPRLVVAASAGHFVRGRVDYFALVEPDNGSAEIGDGSSEPLRGANRFDQRVTGAIEPIGG